MDRAIAAGFGGAVAFYSPYTPRTRRAFLDMHAGNRVAAKPLIDAALAINRTALESGYRGFAKLMEDAALYLMNGDRGAALDALDGGVRAGWKDAGFLERDPFWRG